MIPRFRGHLRQTREGEKGVLMTKTRREFSPEFKQEAVALLETSGRPLMQVATEVGVSPSMCGTGGRRSAAAGRDRAWRRNRVCRQCRRRRIRPPELHA
jgi:hypothetical protein